MHLRKNVFENYLEVQASTFNNGDVKENKNKQNEMEENQDVIIQGNSKIKKKVLFWKNKIKTKLTPTSIHRT
jgi:hypothetical protein